ncbi:D-arabino-3-hexulose 6-phosphate formaldehyde-lyase [Lentilactobacillus kosonis]|uniref:D-arabino-3-hexulose 6-phosphate formaldehyde-lyase n=1 Tax=Lentilactobacillus kosonis TaxID=2810561 RepID=A0A401FIM7_9LACO|nr:D-arabino-3-hexulose 6-phosphate formaldehyde-lyase [Lentilactobacillus kosonis]
MFIDLLEVEDSKIKQIANFENAIYGLHHSKDNENAFDAVESVAEFYKQFPEISNIAVAGGIDLDQAKKLADQGIADIIIVGGKISGADDPIASAKQFMEEIK